MGVAIFISWLILCVVVGSVAQGQGRSFGSYFALSLFLSPLIGFIVLAIKGKATPEEAVRQSKHIFYCTNCQSTYSSFGEHTEYCPQCNRVLMETTVSADQWRSYDSTKKASMKQAFNEGQFALANIGAPVPQVVVQQNNSADELKKFKELLDMGAITQEEFDAKKKQLLGL